MTDPKLIELDKLRDELQKKAFQRIRMQIGQSLVRYNKIHNTNITSADISIKVLSRIDFFTRKVKFAEEEISKSKPDFDRSYGYLKQII